ncbi:MAG: hypothetical protein A2402_02755 [Candidatus Staskawiczbacteria bacterium RIFOXYC1_FULL_37_43]|nr:MAG: hypothetical protein A2813_03470 [Candidatus Staskawiczbacteria bacterium RIFCSPHIGHO2_01_FULL_37_17]OGZ71524.1 MAG: hypothetical protein A2891_02340 [Candidatus Staskawiczbacteria bacterium RIFCSPLOWO2_01_FULL_37_19]OGZ76280.1 MAG: hypothetical protein A2205_00705 [Candidatus Staskawiczbacteria bacterium RIFOXYA1_FULL_37_15]OGZ80295.1 MAG: hypothetical protein A2353_03415 [Candidatus Staskawiczbacteria bacterium RIFOXYB1_FULL_38_37]OGZ81900.1 MAG: hypothetical protein A2402_02755 [Cand
MLSILVDLMNLQKAAEKISLETIIGEIIQKAQSRDEIQEVILFVPCYQSSAPWQTINELQCKYGVQVVACAVLRNGGNAWKDTVDLQFLLWVKNHMHRNVGPNLLVFVTGDSHYMVAAREAEKKDKTVEFWFLKKSPNVSAGIRYQENFQEIIIAPASNPSGENPFLDALGKLVSSGESSLDQEDKRRIRMVSDFAKADIKNGLTREGLAESASKKLGFELADTKMLVEALMVADIARIYPAINLAISLDRSSDLLQWISRID